MQEKYLDLPLSEGEVRKLEIGDRVFLSGPVLTGRSLFHIRAVDQGIVPPVDFNRVNVLMHAGPMVEKTGNLWRPISMTLTASIRFEKYGAAVIRKLGLRAMVGKTTMGPDTMREMQAWGAVHLTAVGIMTNILPGQIKKIEDVYFLDELGKTEATWVMELEKGGPFLVDIDAHGNNLFHEIDQRVGEKFKEIYRQFGVPEGYQYSDLNG